ncbi:hypothetical protein Tco_0011813 [Tanacetum coccineum]
MHAARNNVYIPSVITVLLFGAAKNLILFFEFRETTSTFDAFPSNIPTFSPATCRWGNISPAKCHWGKVDGVSSMAKRSPATIPCEKWAQYLLVKNWCHGGYRFPATCRWRKGPLSLTFNAFRPESFVL